MTTESTMAPQQQQMQQQHMTDTTILPTVGLENNGVAAVMQHVSSATVVLESLNNTFMTKVLHLVAREPIKIGRKIAKSTPESHNGIFDAKVLSRHHAELSLEDGKVYVRDFKSSNGTFINGVQIGEEGTTSAPAELRTGDVLDFGVDIREEATNTISFPRVSCKVTIRLGSVDHGVAMPTISESLMTQSSVSSVSIDAPGGLVRETSSLSEVTAMLEEELKLSTDAANMLQQIRSTFDVLEDQLYSVPPSIMDEAGDHAERPLTIVPKRPASTTNANLAKVAPVQSPLTSNFDSSALMETIRLQHATTKELLDKLGQVASQTSHIDTRLGSLVKDVSNHNSRIEEIKTSINETAATLTEQAVSKATAAAKDATSKSLVEFGSKLEDAQSRILVVEKSLSQLPKQSSPPTQSITPAALAELRAKMNTDLREMESQTTKRLEAVDRQSTILRNHLKLQESENERFDQHLSALRAELAAATIANQKRDSALDSSRDQIASLKSALNETRAELEAVRKLATFGSTGRNNVPNTPAGANKSSSGTSSTPHTPSSTRRRKNRSNNDLHASSSPNSSNVDMDSMDSSSSTVKTKKSTMSSCAVFMIVFLVMGIFSAVLVAIFMDLPPQA